MTNTPAARKNQDPIKEMSNSIIQILEGLGFVLPKEEAEKVSTNYLNKKKG